MTKSHGMTGTPEYTAWKSMKKRCYNQNDSAYEYYGARGIAVCEEWVESFEAFFSDMGHIPERGYTLERIDNDGDYCPENCKWATRAEQSWNTRVYKNNTSGVKGVSFHKREGKWRATIGSKSLGDFDTFEEACCVRKSAENKKG